MIQSLTILFSLLYIAKEEVIDYLKHVKTMIKKKKGIKSSDYFYLFILFIVLMFFSRYYFPSRDYILVSVFYNMFVVGVIFYYFIVRKHYLYCHEQMMLYVSSCLMYLGEHGVVYHALYETCEVLNEPIKKEVEHMIELISSGERVERATQRLTEQIEIPIIKYLHITMQQITDNGLLDLNPILFRVTTELEEWSQIQLNQQIKKTQLRFQYYFLIMGSLISFVVLKDLLVVELSVFIHILTGLVYISLTSCLMIGEYLMSKEEFRIVL